MTRASVWASQGRPTAERAGFVVLIAAFLLAVVALPFAIASMAGTLNHPVAADAFHIAVPGTNQSSTTAMNVRLVGIDETNQKVTLAVTGDRQCVSQCGQGEVIQFFSLRSDPRGSDGAPPSQGVTVPPKGEFDTSIDLPIAGGLGSYPFDHYHLLLGIALQAEDSGGNVVALPATAARRQLDVSLDEQLPRLSLATPKDVSGRYRYVGANIAVATTIDLSRPFYLQALTVLTIVFIAIAGVYSVVTRAFKEVIGTVGVVVLGVWGVRTLLVGSYPPDSTAVDLILTFLILMLLMILMLRGVLLMWGRIGRGSSVDDVQGSLNAGSRAAEERETEESGLDVLSEIA